MTSVLLRKRLSNQALARARFRRPEELVAWFGAVQAQDYLGSLWGIGQRVRGATEADVEAAEARRAIVRTWPMRGTLHFVAAADARWMIQLLAPRVIARNAARWSRDFGVDDARLALADEIVTRALEGGKRLARDQLYDELESRRVPTGASRGLHLLLCLAMRGRLCLAGRVGKQHSFALLDEWLPATRTLERDAALAALATRYFAGHGPATQRDLMWWSGITAADARIAIDGAQRGLERETIDGESYWSGASPRARGGAPTSPPVRLLPAFDEFTVAYADRKLLLEPRSRLSARGMGLLSPAVLVDGRVVGTWKRTIKGRRVQVDARLARRLTRAERAGLDDAVEDYGRFLGLEIAERPRA
jgi:hypothetical protein